jgi:long-chain acyl-CoA synthetase
LHDASVLAGNSFESTLVAIVVPHQAHLEAWAKHAGLASPDFPALCKNPEAIAHVLAVLKEQAKASKLRGFEFVKGVTLDAEEFSVENDTLTPTFKLRRPQLLARYKADVDRMYAVTRGGK